MEEIFSTRDIYLATTLVTLKFYLVGVDFVIEGDKNMPIGYFKFRNSEELQTAKSDYTQGLVKIEPKTFVTNLKSLKSEVINAQRNPHIL